MVLIGRAQEVGRRAAALTGAFAILVQAVLFGWHHHAILFRQHVALGVIILAPPSSPAMPAADEHDCQICFALGHHGAVPVNFFAPSPPDQAGLHQPRLSSVDAPIAPYFSFQSRAPPVA
jgi:hypothetical protein